MESKLTWTACAEMCTKILKESPEYLKNPELLDGVFEHAIYVNDR